MEEFVRFKEVLSPVGIYALYWQGTIVYIGKSLNVFSRLSTHYVAMRRRLNGQPEMSGKGPPILFDDVWVKWVHIDKLDQEEIKLIQRYQPMHNAQLNRPRRDLSHIPAFMELLKKAQRQPTVLRRTLHPTPRYTLPNYKPLDRRWVNG